MKTIVLFVLASLLFASCSDSKGPVLVEAKVIDEIPMGTERPGDFSLAFSDIKVVLTARRRTDYVLYFLVTNGEECEGVRVSSLLDATVLTFIRKNPDGSPPFVDIKAEISNDPISKGSYRVGLPLSEKMLLEGGDLKIKFAGDDSRSIIFKYTPQEV